MSVNGHFCHYSNIRTCESIPTNEMRYWQAIQVSFFSFILYSLCLCTFLACVHLLTDFSSLYSLQIWLCCYSEFSHVFFLSQIVWCVTKDTLLVRTFNNDIQNSSVLIISQWLNLLRILFHFNLYIPRGTL